MEEQRRRWDNLNSANLNDVSLFTLCSLSFFASFAVTHSAGRAPKVTPCVIKWIQRGTGLLYKMRLRARLLSIWSSGSSRVQTSKHGGHGSRCAMPSKSVIKRILLDSSYKAKEMRLHTRRYCQFGVPFQ
jgi:hypothetical protein